MSPTPQQIAQVQANLKNLQSLNDYIYNQGAGSRISNAYLLMSEPPPGDSGLAVGLSIMGGALVAVTAELGPIGALVGSFLSGMLAEWAKLPPVELNTTFASLELRLQHTSLAMDAQFATYYQDVAGNWDVNFPYQGQSQPLSHLASVTIPAETDPAFEKLAQAGIFAMDQEIWRSALQAKYFITAFYYTDGPAWIPWGDDPNVRPVAAYEAFLKDRPGYYCTMEWFNPDPRNVDPGWAVQPFNLGTGGYGGLNADASRYLFIDSADGVVTNPDGLFPRATVFTGLGIPKWPRPERWPPV